jgi:xanthine dehydrogenase large subunit
MIMIEQIIDAMATYLRLEPLTVRQRNFYGEQTRNVTPYGQIVQGNRTVPIVDELVRSANYQERLQQIAQWNATQPLIRRGIALTPVKFGISFTATHFNQAGALVHVYTDGSVLLNHGGTEMGQGLFTKVAQVVAHEFGLPLTAIRVSATDTSKVPNTSATAASSGADLNGKAAQAAAQTIRERLVQFACERFQVAAADIRFAQGQVQIGEQQLPFAKLVQQAYRARVSLSSTGYYRTPRIQWDNARMTGQPFFYFAFGAAVSEVAIDTLTGETRLLRVDILHDVGKSLNPAIDMGQIEGGFLQGVGWLTSEELWWDAKGQLRTHAPSTYKIPAVGDWPTVANIRLFEGHPNHEETIYQSKAVGEPPLMLGISVLLAIRHAVASCGPAGALVELMPPATPESVLRAISAVREVPL